MVEAYRAALEHLNREQGPLALVLVPHDRRPLYSDVSSLFALSDVLPSNVARSTALLEQPGTAADVKAIVAKCDLVLAGRMHLAIAALGSGVPVGSLGYQGKCEGLFRHFDLEDLVLDWREAIQPDRLRSWLAPVVSRREQIAAQIAVRLPAILELANMNLRHIPGFPKR
jgi:polysaccharide pyruvyl transferase WcaK-like protein